MAPGDPSAAFFKNNLYEGRNGAVVTSLYDLERAEVLRPDGTPIPGLYAAGNVMANAFGSKGVGAGTTLGPCLTWGYIAGMSAAGA